MNSMFGGAPPQGMFGGQQQGPLMQLLASNPQLMQMLLAGGNQTGMPPMAPPMGGPVLEQYNAGPGRVPGTVDQNVLLGIPPQNPGATGAFGGIPPEILRMLLTPRQI